MQMSRFGLGPSIKDIRIFLDGINKTIHFHYGFVCINVPLFFKLKFCCYSPLGLNVTEKTDMIGIESVRTRKTSNLNVSSTAQCCSAISRAFVIILVLSCVSTVIMTANRGIHGL